jgi:hypothetical protein
MCKLFSLIFIIFCFLTLLLYGDKCSLKLCLLIKQEHTGTGKKTDSGMDPQADNESGKKRCTDTAGLGPPNFKAGGHQLFIYSCIDLRAQGTELIISQNGSCCLKSLRTC